MKELKTIRDILQALLDGHEIEFKREPRAAWEPVENVRFNTRCLDKEPGVLSKCRIKTTKPSIDWSQVSDKFKYLARDESGLIYLYENKPKVAYDGWLPLAGVGGVFIEAAAFKSLETGNCHWTESLVERPRD